MRSLKDIPDEVFAPLEQALKAIRPEVDAAELAQILSVGNGVAQVAGFSDLHADELVIMAQGRVVHQGRCAEAVTHRALEAVFDHRIEVHALQGRWVAMPCVRTTTFRKEDSHAD